MAHREGAGRTAALPIWLSRPIHLVTSAVVEVPDGRFYKQEDAINRFVAAHDGRLHET